MSGLRNRFSNATRYVWLYWYSCMICGMNQIDALHHIISPSSHLYVDGEHNSSVFNSCPIHNMKCHIGNESWLYKDESIKYLLKKTKSALYEIGYIINEKDKKFLEIYAKLY